MGRNISDHSESPVRGQGSSHRRSPTRRDRSPARHKSSHRVSSPAREKHSRPKSPNHGRSRSPAPRSPSPRTKRIKRAQAEKDAPKVSEREHERSRGRSDKEIYKERGLEREAGEERKLRRPGRDDNGSKSARSRHSHSTSPSETDHRSRHRSMSPQQDSDTRARHEVRNSRGTESRSNDDDPVSKMETAEAALEAKQKDEPSFDLSGKLAAETNRVRGVTLLFTELPDARKPDIRWRLYVFKGGEVLNEPLYIHRQSCYLFGRERRVADIPTDHPSCSKQHAVIQFRQVEKEQPDGMLKKEVRPYVMDLGSTNKTYLNENAIEPQRYYELFEKDTIKFGNSSREYVLLHENSAT